VQVEPAAGVQPYCPRCGRTFPAFIGRCPDDGDALVRWRAPSDPAIGTVLDDRYRLVRKLGEGAMGIVYEAIQLSVDRRVAVKVIRDELIADGSTGRRFLREARMLTSTRHPSIVDVFDLGTTAAGAPYLVMEMLHGATLADQLAAGELFEPRRACDIAIQLCDALTAAHASGIVHRDLKPANIVIVEALDLVKVLDFGLAKSLAAPDALATGDTVTQAGTIMGTPLYMAPEAIAGAAADERTDLYALGSILYELVAGRAPFADANVGAVLARQLHDPPPPLPPYVPPRLAALVLALLAKRPASRPPSALEVRAQLFAIRAQLADDLDDAATLTPADVAPVAARSYTWLLALIAGGVFGLLVVLAVILLA